jgi:hypothetical protein
MTVKLRIQLRDFSHENNRRKLLLVPINSFVGWQVTSVPHHSAAEAG